LKSLANDIACFRRDTGDISAWSVQAIDQSSSNWIANTCEHNRYCAGSHNGVSKEISTNLSMSLWRRQFDTSPRPYAGGDIRRLIASVVFGFPMLMVRLSSEIAGA
jgi:hypothetical protein